MDGVRYRAIEIDADNYNNTCSGCAGQASDLCEKLEDCCPWNEEIDDQQFFI